MVSVAARGAVLKPVGVVKSNVTGTEVVLMVADVPPLLVKLNGRVPLRSVKSAKL